MLHAFCSSVMSVVTFIENILIDQKLFFYRQHSYSAWQPCLHEPIELCCQVFHQFLWPTKQNKLKIQRSLSWIFVGAGPHRVVWVHVWGPVVWFYKFVDKQEWSAGRKWSITTRTVESQQKDYNSPALKRKNISFNKTKQFERIRQSLLEAGVESWKSLSQKDLLSIYNDAEAYIVVSWGASQLGGSLLGIPLGDKAN